MLREDGLVMDDGTTARMSENHFIMTTTTANADSVYRHLEFCHQCLWPEMEVHLISTTDAWAQIAIAGPNSRKVLSKIVDPEFDISNESFLLWHVKKYQFVVVSSQDYFEFHFRRIGIRVIFSNSICIVIC